MLTWTPEDLGTKVYNEDYVKFDPDYTEIRPKNYAVMFRGFPAISPLGIKHLDYGSGSGVMARELRKYRWNSTCYDPYSSNVKPTTKFNFITAIEVFEHSLNIDNTIEDIKGLLEIDKGVVCFSTQLADYNTSIDWWYIGARNGHISILSEKSLKIIAARHGMFFSSINPNIHLLQSKRSNYRGLFQRKI
jgi:2-polyprenyl-6-hydroxyphenyl methylase/3-demethylubiquinone-9 3-methyltransferase